MKMNWRVLISILIMIPDPMQMRKHENEPMKINRALYTIPQRKFIPSDTNDPKQIMEALNSLPKANQVNISDLLPKAQLQWRQDVAKYPKQVPTFLWPITKQNNITNNVQTPKFRRNTDYFLKQMNRAANRDERHDPSESFSYRRRHSHDNPNLFIKEMNDVPDIESMIPDSYIKTHPGNFKKFHSVLGNDAGKIYQKRKKDHPFPAMQYAEMQSMNQIRKSNSKLWRQVNLPEFSKEKLDHVGNSLFYVNKGILGSHSFPKKKKINAVYGNLESLGIKAYPDSREIRKRKFKKMKKRIPDAQYNPELLYNPNHPGLNLLNDKKMWLEAAKFAKPSNNLVYGNLNNLGVREGESSRYQLSDFRRSNNLRRATFHRLNNGRLNIRPIARERYILRDEVQPYGRSDNIVGTFYEAQKNNQPQKRKIKSDANKKKKNAPDIKYLMIARNDDNDDEDKESLKIKGSKQNKGNKNEGGSKKVDSKLVYGNTDNVGIRYAKTPFVLMYTDFRKRPQKRKSIRSKDNNKDVEKLVYGDKQNIGIRYAKEPFVTTYTDFRKQNGLSRLQKYLERYNIQTNTHDEDSENVIMSALKAIQDYDKKNSRSKNGRLSQLIALEPGDLNNKIKKYRPLKYYLDGEINENENGANEILESFEDDPQNLRRSKGRAKYTSYEKHVLRNGTLCSDKSSSSSSSSSGSDDKNPGNPYTIFKSKYRQNWPWNHFMDGDHMNINPYGPKFDNLGPTGNEMFFGRKWWYFNQDDYKPFRKR